MIYTPPPQREPVDLRGLLRALGVVLIIYAAIAMLIFTAWIGWAEYGP